MDSYYFSYLDLLPYFLISIFLLVVSFSALNDRTKSTYIFIMFFVFLALRYDVGWDYEMYQSQIIVNDLSRYEPISKLILWSGYITDFYPLPFIIYGYLTLIFFKKTIDTLSTNSSLSWIVYFGLPFLFLASLSTLRQNLAAMIVFYSFIFLMNKKYVAYLIWILIATLVHTSAIGGLLLLVFSIVKLNNRLLFILALVSLFIKSSLKEFLTPIILQYTDNIQVTYYLNNPQKESQILYILFSILVFFNLLFYKKLIELNSLNKNYIQISTLGFVFYMLLSFEPNTAYRIGGMFMIFWVLIIPYYGKVLSSKSPNIVNFLISIAVISLPYILIMKHVYAYLSQELIKNSFLPYKFWFFNL